MKTYLEKLRDPRWQKKRLKILDRDNFTCQLCDSKDKTLHVHHKYSYYGDDPWDYEDYSLITLCEKCHEFETENKKNSEYSLVVFLYDTGAQSSKYLDILLDVMQRSKIGYTELIKLISKKSK